MPIKPFPSNFHLQEFMDPACKANLFNSCSGGDSWASQFYNEPRNVDYGLMTTAQLMGGVQEEYRDLGICDERETMFEKPLTPSDVGKLNRLVIPKQHAERYFPLDGSGSSSSSLEPGEKGIQLSFEDEEGKLWRFRYSYWNSSQSYVLTKGWSRFVKEKRLDAGDIVSFRRERPSGEKMFIGWRRRDVPVPQESSGARVAGSAAAGGGPPQWGSTSSYSTNPAVRCIARQRDGLLHAGGEGGSSRTPANSKRVRLFGVNLDCPADESVPDPSFLESESGPHVLFSSVQFSGSSSQT